MRAAALGAIASTVAFLGGLWALLRVSKRPMPSPPDPLGDVEADWAAIVADLRKEQE